MDIYTCANSACGKIFTPSSDSYKNFGKYCSKNCLATKPFVDVRTENRNNAISQLKPYIRDWRDTVQPKTLVYLDQNTTMIFKIIFAERGIAWIQPAVIKDSHNHLDDGGKCWCEGEKLVTLSRCDLVNTNTQKRVA